MFEHLLFLSLVLYLLTKCRFPNEEGRNFQMLKRFLAIFAMLFVLVACDEFITETTTNDDSTTNTEQGEDKSASSKDKENESSPAKQTTKQLDLDGLTVHFIDVGQGDATLFTYDDKVILLDAGDWTDTKALDYLQQQNIEQIDLAIMTHPHSDHIGQIADIIKQIDVKEVWMSGDEHTSKTYEHALQAVLDHDVEYREPRSGDVETIGDLQLEVLHPKSLNGELNEDSISVRISYGDMHFVFTGDAYQTNEAEMMQRHSNLEAQILHLGHHGSNTSSSQAFLDAVNPDVAIYSAGKDNMYGHPHREVVERVTSSDITLLGTDDDGTIIVKTDGKTYTVEAAGKHIVDGKGKKDETEPKQAEAPKAVDVPETSETTNAKDNTPSSDCININEADTNELTKIIHIGNKRAEDLIDNRPYDNVKDLQRINGIGQKRIKDIEAEGLACAS